MYLLTGDAGIFVVDPSVSPERAERYSDVPGLSNGESQVRAILITHGHHDHIKYVNTWKELFPDADIFFSSNDLSLLGDGFMNCSYMEGFKTEYRFDYIDVAGKNGSTVLKEEDIDISILETPGHTTGSVCFLVDLAGKKMLFTGDTVFSGSVGRTDMPGGSSKELVGSIRKISSLDPGLRIFPGHGPDSTVGDEIEYNPFFRD